jgi:hypothetical protein
MRYYGKIGYFDTVETKPGLFENQMIYKTYKGDVLRNYKRNQDGSKVNSDISVNNSISIVADPYAREHFFNIKCVEWQGALWTVSSVEVQYPRLILELGGLYNEDLE